MDELGRAIEDLYRRRHDAFWNVISSLTHDREAAQDVVQEAFARAFSKRRQLRDPAALEPWIWRIALRIVHDRAGVSTVPLDEVLDPALPEPERDPDLDAALRGLSPRRRLVVFLRYFADLSYAEIAAATEIAEGTVAATLAQARHELVARLAQEEAETLLRESLAIIEPTMYRRFADDVRASLEKIASRPAAATAPSS
jgi:RNA polymerase sigma-70 factor (ECF subfamily)